MGEQTKDIIGYDGGGQRLDRKIMQVCLDETSSMKCLNKGEIGMQSAAGQRGEDCGRI